uniref:Uncharacterized protein n=1 Tax=Timema monikensis TaxID=170555 RepID=A0A7R9EIR8_9NEOP|nr:unnamed protein product [Timema monikensis]
MKWSHLIDIINKFSCLRQVAVVLLSVFACSVSAGLLAAPASVLVRTPSLDSAVIKSDRLGGNFAYSSVEGTLVRRRQPRGAERGEPRHRFLHRPPGACWVRSIARRLRLRSPCSLRLRIPHRLWLRGPRSLRLRRSRLRWSPGRLSSEEQRHTAPLQ